jgi:flavodoxin
MLKTLLSLILVAGVGYLCWNCCAAQKQENSSLESHKTPKVKKDLGKVLIVYYSLDGNTKMVVDRIGKMINATICKIETAEKYSSAPIIYWTSWKQKNNGDYPKLKNKIPDFSSYDLIIIGSPVWWYTVPAPLLSLLSESDFKGKTVVPFVTHGGNTGNFFDDFRKKIKNAKVIDGADFCKVSKEDLRILDEKISTWLDNLKYTK